MEIIDFGVSLYEKFSVSSDFSNVSFDLNKPEGLQYFTSVVQGLCKHCASAVQALYKCYPSALQVFCKCYAKGCASAV